jgi:signal transduction histidine kinase
MIGVLGCIFQPRDLGLVLVAAGLCLLAGATALAARPRAEARRLRKRIAELEATQQSLTHTSRELTAALGEAAQASQAKSAFLASMSHELRTPLNAVIGFSETMVMEVFGPLGDRYKSYAADIHSSGAHLLSLINDVLDLSRLDSGQTELHEEIFDPVELIAEAMRMMVGQAQQAKVVLTTDLGHGLPWLKADKRRIKQILINLASNAVKFTPVGGHVRVSAQLTDAGLALAVSDSGIGIAADDIPKVLKRFGQVDSHMARKCEGTGLGLPLSKQLAELHGGNLVLESILGTGTTVTVNLPRNRLVTQQGVSAVA